MHMHIVFCLYSFLEMGNTSANNWNHTMLCAKILPVLICNNGFMKLQMTLSDRGTKTVSKVTMSAGSSGLLRAVSCPICFKIYSDPTVLDCGHTYCLR